MLKADFEDLKKDLAITIVGKFVGKARRKNYISNVLKAAENIESGKAANYIADAQAAYVEAILEGITRDFIVKHNGGEITTACFSPEANNILSSSRDGITSIHALENSKRSFKFSSFLLLEHFAHNDCTLSRGVALSPHQKDLVAQFIGFL